MRKKLLGFISVWLIGLSTLVGCGDQPQPPQTPIVEPMDPTPAASPTPRQAALTPASLTKVTIALGYIPNVQFAPFYVALEKGYYDAEGLDVTFQHGVVPELIKLLGEGSSDVNFAAVSGDEIIPARMQGIPVRYVMTWYRQYPVAAASIEGKGPTLNSPADLKGRTIGIPGPFGANYIGLQALLKSQNLTLQDVTVKNIEFTQVASLSEGLVEVAMVYAANEPVQLRSTGAKVSTLMVSDYVRLAANGLATNEKTLKENPDLVRKVISATIKGMQDTINNPEAAFAEAIKQVPEAGTPANKDLQLNVLRETTKLMQAKADDPAASRPLGWTNPEVWTSTQDFLFDIGIITQKGKVEEMFTNEFIGPPTE